MNNILKVISISIGAFLIINTAILALVSNFNAGLILTVLVGATFLIYGLYFNKIHNAAKSGVLKWVKYCVYLLTIFMTVVIAFIAVYGNFDTVTYDEDAVIVLGAGINGENLTYPLLHRLNKAVEYSNKNPNATIIVSGGKGLQEDITEALAMERYLIKKGVVKDKILKEEKATSTFENFNYSKEILDVYFDKPYKIAFVTSTFHIYRASRLAKITGFDATHYHAKIEWYTIAINHLREFTAVLKLWVLRR